MYLIIFITASSGAATATPVKMVINLASDTGLALIPFGLHCVLTGCLIVRSTFLPRVLGVLMAVAGLGYMICLWPSVADRIFFPYIVVPGVLGEGSLTLWLLVMGVNDMRWRERDERGASTVLMPLDGPR